MASNAVTAKLKAAFPALTHRNFQYYFGGQCISMIGTWMQRTAQMWLVYTLTNSPLLLGLLGVAQFAPVLVLTLFAGVLVDRYPKKKVLIITQAALMIQALLLALLVWSGHVQYWHVFVLAVVMGLANTVDMPARQSFVIELVGRANLTNAISLNSSVINLARIIGPAVSAILMDRYGAALCFFLNGVSFIPVIIGLALTKPIISTAKVVRKKMLVDIWDGLKYIWARPVILMPTLAVLFVGTFAMNTNIIFPVFSDKVLNQGVQGYGMLLSAMGVGSLTSALVLAASIRSNPKRKIIYVSALLTALFQIATSFISNLHLALFSVLLLGAFNIMFMNSANSMIQLNASDEYRGRVMSVYALCFGGTTPVGNLFAGSIMEKFGPAAGLLMCGTATGILILGLLFRMYTSERKERAAA